MLSKVATVVAATLMTSTVLAYQQAPSQVMTADGQIKLMSLTEFAAGALPAYTAGVVAPKVNTIVAAKYTADAMRQKIQGDVGVDVIIEPDGKVSRAMVTKSLQPDLDLNALTAAIADTFQPGTVNGKPVAVLAHMNVTFRLH